MSKNEDKNLERDKRLDNLRPVPFTSEYQPSPEAKSKGWERRRVKQEIMDMITRLRDLSMKDLEDLKEDIKNNPDKHTVLEAKMVQYISKERFTVDFLDRNVGKPQQDIDLQGNVSLTVKDVIKELRELDNEPID